MKLRCVLGVALGLWATQISAQEPRALTAPKDKTSYGMGVALARSFKSQGIDVDPELLAKGLKDVLSGEKLLMSDDDLRTTMTAFEEEVRQKQAQARSVAAENNKKAGDAFLAENARKDGVVVLPSGLQYKILKAGEGKKPTDTDTVVCQYRGTLIDGTEFDSSYRSGQPATFEVKGVIPGFREALKLMPVGSKWQLVIPSELAYGDRGAGNAIEPNATLIFEIELISIKDKP
jgi:UDP-GlcNAc:undecaprenyl-phosphate/decaprenyl-phosphate GlcNAc-1-phosphate transferase